MSLLKWIPSCFILRALRLKRVCIVSNYERGVPQGGKRTRTTQGTNAPRWLCTRRGKARFEKKNQWEHNKYRHGVQSSFSLAVLATISKPIGRCFSTRVRWLVREQLFLAGSLLRFLHQTLDEALARMMSDGTQGFLRPANNAGATTRPSKQQKAKTNNSTSGNTNHRKTTRQLYSNDSKQSANASPHMHA